MQTIRTEDDHLCDYKAEVEHLKREKMLHIESLRHIERDLNMVRFMQKNSNSEHYST